MLKVKFISKVLIENKKKSKEKAYTFKTRLKEQVPKPPTSPLRSAAKNFKIINEGPTRKYFNLHFVKHGDKILKNAPKKD